MNPSPIQEAERYLVAYLAACTGAEFRGSMTPTSTFCLIAHDSTTLSDPKPAAAVAQHVPIVTVHWLRACLSQWRLLPMGELPS